MMVVLVCFLSGLLWLEGPGAIKVWCCGFKGRQGISIWGNRHVVTPDLNNKICSQQSVVLALYLVSWRSKDNYFVNDEIAT